MTPLLWFGVRSFVLALILTPIVRDIFHSYGVVDQPDKSRKVHRYPIPRVGGIAIVVSYFAAFYLWRPEEPHLAGVLNLVERLLPAACVVFAVGLIDDFFGLKPWQKLLGQLGAAMLALHAGVRVSLVARHATGDVLGMVLTVVWLLACINAFNLVDGLDGLAAGIGLFATLTIFAGGMIQHSWELQFATLPLAGALLAFLCYNFNPATVFLGDGGSMLIGFLLGCYGATWSQKSVTLLGMTAPLMALSIPLLDTMLAIVRRFLRRQPIFGADRGHIHHKLLDRGLTPRRVVFVIYGTCGLAAACSLLQSLVSNIYLAMFLISLFISGAWLGVHYLGYAELVLVRRLVTGNELQRAVQTHLALDSVERSMANSRDCDECWLALRSAYRSFGFCGVRLTLQGLVYEDWDKQATEETCWTVRVPLEGSGQVEFIREFGAPALSASVVPLIEMVRSSFSGKPRGAARSAAAGGEAL